MKKEKKMNYDSNLTIRFKNVIEDFDDWQRNLIETGFDEKDIDENDFKMI
jgi:hypothetical protein